MFFLCRECRFLVVFFLFVYVTIIRVEIVVLFSCEFCLLIARLNILMVLDIIRTWPSIITLSIKVRCRATTTLSRTLDSFRGRSVELPHLPLLDGQTWTGNRTALGAVRAIPTKSVVAVD